MRTLDKIWERMQSQEEDIIMEDKEEKTDETLNHQGTSKTKITTYADTSDNDKPTMMQKGRRHDFLVRFKIKAESTKQAFKQHKQVLTSIERETEYCGILSEQGEYINPVDTQETTFTYHEVGKRNKQYIIVHEISLDIPYHQLKKNPNIIITR